jgi:raffinose/stachyose/melibiose transport system substrate-binding protein
MHIGYFPLPGSNTASQNQSSLQPDLTWTVLKNAKNKANALKWLDYFARPAVYAKYVKATGISPSFQGSFPSATRGILGSYLSKGLLEANAEPALPNAGPFGLQPSNFYATLQNVLDGQRPVRSTAAQWEAQWRQMLASK